MNPSLLLVVPALVFTTPAQPPSLPSPTPGLDEAGQRFNFQMLTQGKVASEFTVDGRRFTIRTGGLFFALYNDEGHLIVMAESLSEKVCFAAGETDKDPFPVEAPSVNMLMDGINYTIKGIILGGRPLMAVYNGKHHIVCALVNANLKAVLVPRPTLPV
jgi:hypothetical protein